MGPYKAKTWENDVTYVKPIYNEQPLYQGSFTDIKSVRFLQKLTLLSGVRTFRAVLALEISGTGSTGCSPTKYPIHVK